MRLLSSRVIPNWGRDEVVAEQQIGSLDPVFGSQTFEGRQSGISQT